MKRFLVAILLLCLVAGVVDAQEKALPLPKVSVEVGKATKPEDVSVTLQILFLMTILSLAPAILILTTAFTRTTSLATVASFSISVIRAPTGGLASGKAALPCWAACQSSRYFS